MTTTVPAPATSTVPAPTAAPAAPVDNRPTYLAWGLAWLLGHGTAALAGGPGPLPALPPWLPAVVLAAGVVAALAVTGAVTARAQRRSPGADPLPGALLGGAWVVGFAALLLLITALAGTLDAQHLQGPAWPAGTGLVVGLLYLMGGALQRDVLQYALGTWLALVATSAVFLGASGQDAATAVLGGGGYLLAAALERRRLAALGA